MKQISAQKPHALQLPKLQRKEPEIHIEHNNMDFEVEQQETWEKYLVANPKNLLRKPIVPRILTRPSSVQLSFRNAQIDQSFQMSYQTKPHFQTTSVSLSTRFCVSTGFDGKTVIHDLLNQTQNAIQSSYPVFCSKVDENVNSNLFAVGSLYGNVHVTNFNGDEIFSANTDSAILSLDFKQKLAVGTESGMCVIYDIERKTQQKLIQHYAEVVQMQIEGNLCYTAGFDGVVNRNDLRAHAEETEGLHNFESSLISHKSPIIKMKIVNNKLLTVQLWEVELLFLVYYVSNYILKYFATSNADDKFQQIISSWRLFMNYSLTQEGQKYDFDRIRPQSTIQSRYLIFQKGKIEITTCNKRTAMTKINAVEDVQGRSTNSLNKLRQF
ncbi:WD40/YVTN_repeat-like-containing domain superfamily [Hexamita inflata]|uniref:WD40/YVTN repeat-like-containing domain superfamily n=1 Tax=Hexamita inflata TaxID=28002 RepID=A0AA86R791_9EUKA|nr:WD40/YVTN repeat-like-containing domain superfamily [Hexamita inflata]